MIYVILVDLLFLAVLLGFAAIFRRQLAHVYAVGREDAVKCMGLGLGIGFVMALALVLGKSLLPEGKVVWLIYLVLFPLALTGLSSGFLLIAGMLGFDGARQWVLSILVVGGAATFASSFFPVGGGFIFSGVSAYGLGAALLALWTPMAEEAPEQAAGAGVPDAPQPQEPVRRTRLSGDISPLRPPGAENRDE